MLAIKLSENSIKQKKLRNEVIDIRFY